MPPSTAVPKIIQRFRAHEIQRVINAGGYEGGPINVLQRHSNVNVDKIRADHMRLHNPFLPRSLFERTPQSEGTPTAPNASSSETTIEAVQVKSKERKKWAPPKYSLRRQVELVKAARASGTLHLLPPGPKLSVAELQEAKRKVQEDSLLASSGAEGASASGAKQDVARLGSEDMREMVGTERGLVTEADTAADTTMASDGTAATATRFMTMRESKQLGGLAHAGYPGVDFQWEGEVPLSGREKRGGLTVYAGRKRMFKGHKWERALKKRTGQIRMRLRDMRKRIARFRSVSRVPRFLSYKEC